MMTSILVTTTCGPRAIRRWTSRAALFIIEDCPGRSVNYVRGKLILGFLFGQIQSNIILGSNSQIVNTIRKSQDARDALKRLKKAIAAGKVHVGDPLLSADAGYNAQDGNYLGNFVRDAGTYLDFDQASDVNQMKAALGSYDMSASVVGVDKNSRTATVVFRGSNESTLGSAFGVIPFTRPLLNESVTERDYSTGGRGPASPVQESWSFSEKVKW
jgi:hypothetical protein